MIHAVSRSWFGTGPRRWQLDPMVIHADRTRRFVLWELRLLLVIVAVIFACLELGRAILGLPS